MKYQVVISDDLGKFNEMVTTLCNDGWLLQGDHKVTHHRSVITGVSILSFSQCLVYPSVDPLVYPLKKAVPSSQVPIL